MQRISVDLPEPDGPQITIRSPRATFRSMSRNTWKLLPYHLLTLSKVMMGSDMGSRSWRVLEVGRGWHCLALLAYIDLFFDPLAVARHRETEDEVNQCDEEVALQLEGLPVGVRVDGHVQCAREFVQAHDAHQRGVLENGDEAVDDAGHHHGQRLRQHNLALGLPVRQSQRGRCLDLPLGNGLQAAAYDLGQVGRGKQGD